MARLLRFKDILEMDSKNPSEKKPLSFDDLHVTQYRPGEDELTNYRAMKRKKHMYEAYEDKERRKQEYLQNERNEREKERQYFEELARRDKELQMKKAAIKEEKDKIFEKLSAEEQKRQADKEYWENVRNELYIEENERRAKIKELEEREKKQR